MSPNFEAFYAEVVHYFQCNIYIALALAGVLLLLLIRKPKVFFALLLIVVINVSSLYVISNISSLGLDKKKNLVQKSTLHVRAY